MKKTLLTIIYFFFLMASICLLAQCKVNNEYKNIIEQYSLQNLIGNWKCVKIQTPAYHSNPIIIDKKYYYNYTFKSDGGFIDECNSNNRESDKVKLKEIQWIPKSDGIIILKYLKKDTGEDYFVKIKIVNLTPSSLEFDMYYHEELDKPEMKYWLVKD